MQLVEQHVIDKNDPRYSVIGEAAFKSKNLYTVSLQREKPPNLGEERFLGSRSAIEAGESNVSRKAEDTMRNNDAEGSHIPVIPVSEGSLIHTPGNPFCYDETCGCHEDPELIAEVTDAVDQGLL